MKRGHVWEYFQILRKKHDLLLAVVQGSMYRLVLMRSNHYLGLQLNRNVTTNYVHIDLNILYFHQIEYVTILQNTLNQKMFRCHILVYYSN